jgi:hypothetical protein
MGEQRRDSVRNRIGRAATQAIASGRVGLLMVTVLAGVAVAGGVLLRLRLLGSGSPWVDELWTLDAISRSFKEMVGARLVSDQSPPLWTVLSWVWLHLVGTYDVAWMRALPAGFGCVGIAAPIAGAARMPTLRPTFLVMASLMALSLFTIQYGVEFRAYSMMIGLGAVATVIWAGLLTASLPRSGRWIFAFALSGALAGFGHYYGNVLYGAEVVVLLMVLAGERFWRSAGLLFSWGALSLLPVVGWYVATIHWHSNQAVAAPPSLSELQTWLMYAFAPVTNLFADRPPGYPEAHDQGVIIAALVAASILAAVLFYALPRKGRTGFPPAVVSGACAIAVVVGGVCAAWALSLVTPPSMNVRNLAALLPALFLAAACACTLVPERVRSFAASIAIAGLLAANGLFVSQYGVGSLTPAWQAQAGYRDTARVLIAASHLSPAPTLIGLNTSWGWHGQWDAAIRSELGAGPAVSSDPEPLPVLWIDGVEDIKPGLVPSGAVIVFSDFSDQRAADLFSWAGKTVGSCRQSTFGGPAYGVVTLLECG